MPRNPVAVRPGDASTENATAAAASLQQASFDRWLLKVCKLIGEVAGNWDNGMTADLLPTLAVQFHHIIGAVRRVHLLKI